MPVPERSDDLAGRVALVTGVSRRAGIGFGVARRLLGLGADVFARSWSAHDAEQSWDADRGGSEALLAELREAGGRVGDSEGRFLR